MTNIILCGGSGTRLWPISRTLMPKQFVKLFADWSLFQLTVDRNSEFCDCQYVVSNTEQYFLAFDQLEEMGMVSDKYILEPLGRNTAPAITLACMNLPFDEIVLVTPSDHLIKDEKEYQKTLNVAKEFAINDNLVIFGINPTSVETGFGYIKLEDEFSVKSFHEKPDFKTAKSYLEAGNYYWNSGMFMFKAGVFLEELQKYSPDIFNASKKALENAIKSEIIRVKYDDMISIPENSIDCAVIEKSTKVKVIPANIGWSDLGSFDALYEEFPKDLNGNTINSNHISIDSKNNLVYGSNRLIATVGIDDCVIIDTEDAILISKKGLSQKVKEVVKVIEKTTQLHSVHRTAYRPWGTYTILEDTSKYKIKRIEVKPGSRLSLQKHFHRNEHWIVVSGTATVTVGEETRLIRPNESTYIKMGEIHRLENKGKIPVVLIEAQVGEYMGEDDIIRLEDDFNRDDKTRNN